MPAATSTSSITEQKSGLLYWAQRAVEECDKASQGFAADPVHDLRVAIRRCRSMADGFLSVDPDPGWKQMKRMGKPLFAALGNLRDVQVMMEWVDKLSRVDDAARPILLIELQMRENELKIEAQKELEKFDREHWLESNARLSVRAEKIPRDGAVFRLVALERWMEAREQHRQALRNRSATAFHQLRIGIKRLRYTVENFLPSLHAAWAKDLRTLQDALGEVHDFDVLGETLRAHAEIAPAVKADWRATLHAEREKRLAMYRERMVGPKSLWRTWRAELPAGDALEQAGLEKLRLWASFLDPHFSHATRVSGIALQLYDELAEHGVVSRDSKRRRTLEAAALMHEIGRSKQEKGHHKRSFRMLRQLAPPPGWSAADMLGIGIVARYHRGAVAPATHAMFAGMPAGLRTELLKLAGILRFANALDRATQGRESRPELAREDGTLVIRAQHLDGQIGPEGERLARAKYLLEASCGVAIRLESVTAT
jgi:exopolyphosphatase/guanosine-5'-triphosphate,3'-diphosphate pyrophosphatase